jgi:hypothetical protein
LLAWTLLMGAAVAEEPAYRAITNSDATLRHAPSVTAGQSGVIPMGTQISVEICFYEGAYCAIEGDGYRGYVAGELLRVVGDTSTVRAAEQARWALYRENRDRSLADGFEAMNVVIWGDSLSEYAYVDELQNLLIGRKVTTMSVPGETGEMIGKRMLADTKYTTRFKIIWDRHWPGEAAKDYMEQIKPMLDRAGQTGDFLVVSTLPQLILDKGIDPVEDAAVAEAINRELARVYPDNYVDIASAVTERNTRGTDGLHLSQLGETIVARRLAEAVRARTAPTKPE